jgi:hypothetical protein
MAALSDKYETIALMPSGVVVKIKPAISGAGDNPTHAISD